VPATNGGAGFPVVRSLYQKREKCDKLQNSIVLSLPEHYLVAVDCDPLRHLTRLWRFITEQRPAALIVCDARRVVVRCRLGLKERPTPASPARNGQEWG
jgi:hypothetical protein